MGVKISKMLNAKMCFLFFRTRGVRVFCFLAGLFPDQIVYLASACNYDASEKEMECGGLMVIVQICKKYISLGDFL